MSDEDDAPVPEEIQAGVIMEGYELIEMIGRGGFSSVWKVRSLKYDQIFVAKVTHVRSDRASRAWVAFDAEIQALLRLGHPNIVRLYGHFRYFDNFVMILEYLSGGSLEDYIRRGPMCGLILMKTVKEICTALTYAWSQGVQHRDIKPANIMFDSNGRAKLVDFGISTTTTEEEKGHVADFRCSPLCAAPEILTKQSHNPVQSDIWAFGVTILWIAGGRVPWTYADRDEMILKIKYGQYVIPEGMSNRLLAMTRKMLNLSPAKRVLPTEEELNELCSNQQVSKLGSQPDSAMYKSFRGSAQQRREQGGTVKAGSAGPMNGSLNVGNSLVLGPVRRMGGIRVSESFRENEQRERRRVLPSRIGFMKRIPRKSFEDDPQFPDLPDLTGNEKIQSGRLLQH